MLEFIKKNNRFELFFLLIGNEPVKIRIFDFDLFFFGILLQSHSRLFLNFFLHKTSPAQQ